MDRIEYFSSNKQENEMDDLQGPVEADPEYLLIVEANNLAAQIDEEIGKDNRTNIQGSCPLIYAENTW